MKFISLVCIIFLGSNIKTAKAQSEVVANIDTIWTTFATKTYVLFPSKILFADASISGYVVEGDGRMLRAAASKRNVETALCVVRLESNPDKQWNFTIAYTNRLTEEQQSMNLSDIAVEDIPTIENSPRSFTDSLRNFSKKIVNRRLGIIEGVSKADRNSLGVEKGKITFISRVLRKDDDNFYFKIHLINKDKNSDYEIDYLDFNYFDESENRSIKEPSKHQELPIEYRGTLRDKHRNIYAPKKGKAVIYTAIKRYDVSKKGWLLVEIYEKGGSRNLSFKIEYKDLISIKGF